MRPAYVLAAAVSRPLLGLLFRARWSGREHIPASGGAVVASNHLSNTDAFPLALGAFPKREFVFMAKLELFRPPLGPLIRALNGFPVDRSRPDRESLATAIELCRGGALLLMFPEGTRRAKGLRKRFAAAPHQGAARIALRAGVPLVPAAVAGTDRLRSFGKVRVAYGPPIDVSDLAGESRKIAATIATERLMAAITQLEESL